MNDHDALSNPISSMIFSTCSNHAFHNLTAHCTEHLMLTCTSRVSGPITRALPGSPRRLEYQADLLGASGEFSRSDNILLSYIVDYCYPLH